MINRDVKVLNIFILWGKMIWDVNRDWMEHLQRRFISIKRQLNKATFGLLFATTCFPLWSARFFEKVMSTCNFWFDVNYGWSSRPAGMVCVTTTFEHKSHDFSCSFHCAEIRFCSQLDCDHGQCNNMEIMIEIIGYAHLKPKLYISLCPWLGNCILKSHRSI